MPIYCCFYASWFRFTNWKQIKGMKTLCLVEKTMHQHFSNSCYSLHFLFCRFNFGWWFLQKKQQKKWYSFNCIYWYVTYYVLLCCVWSDVSWSLLVKWFCSESFQIMTKDKKQSQTWSAILFVRDVLSLACCTKSRKFEEAQVLGRCMYEFKKRWRLIYESQSYLTFFLNQNVCFLNILMREKRLCEKQATDNRHSNNKRSL